MRAVNLIPMDVRRGHGAPSRSGGAVYGVLGILGVLALIALMYGVSERQLQADQRTLDQLTADSAAGVSAAAALGPYVAFSTMAQEREQTVATIAEQRFDWGLAMRELSRVVPGGVDLVSLDGQRQGAAAAAGGEAAAAALGTPQISIVGCTADQSAVALLMARLRAVRGVSRVRLESSAKGGDDGSSGGSDCRGGNAAKPQFTMVAIFGNDEAAQAAPAAPASPGGVEPPAGTDPAPPAPATEEGAS